MVLLAFLVGCGSTPSTGGSGKENDEEQVKVIFVALQKAIENKDADKIWGMLHKESQEDAERSAKILRDAYAKGTPEEKTKLAKDQGLKGEDLAALKGAGFFTTKQFHKGHQIDELPTSKLDKIEITGNVAKVHYIEPDKDKETLTISREKAGSPWKVTLPMPKGS
jgi:hypothetical protein